MTGNGRRRSACTCRNPAKLVSIPEQDWVVKVDWKNGDGSGRTSAAERFRDFARQRTRPIGLRKESRSRFRDAVLQQDIVRIARRKDHLQIGPERLQALG